MLPVIAFDEAAWCIDIVNKCTGGSMSLPHIDIELVSNVRLSPLLFYYHVDFQTNFSNAQANIYNRWIFNEIQLNNYRELMEIKLCKKLVQKCRPTEWISPRFALRLNAGKVVCSFSILTCSLSMQLENVSIATLTALWDWAKTRPLQWQARTNLKTAETKVN